MKTDFQSLKKEITRLADLDTLKKELNRVASEIKSFDVHITLTPQAKEAFEQLEKRFRDLLNAVADLQRQVDKSYESFVKIVKRTTGKATTRSARGSTKKTSRSTKKAAGKKPTRKTAKSGAKSDSGRTTRKKA